VFLRPASAVTGQTADLVASRLRSAYAQPGDAPPYATWPFTPQAIAKLGDVLPRKALMLCENFRLKCLALGKVSECLDFENSPPSTGAPAAKGENSLDANFLTLKASADLEAVSPEAGDGNACGELISETLELYKVEVLMPDSIDVEITKYSDERRPALHSRLTFTFHAEGDLERHYCFRVIGHSHALSVQARLRAAMTASGIDKKLPFRHLFIVRNAEFPSGKVTNELKIRFLADGGKCVAIAEDDLRTFLALRELSATKPDEVMAWLQSTKPLCKTVFFQSIGLCLPPLSAAVPVDTKTDGRAAIRSPSPTPAPPTPVLDKSPKPHANTNVMSGGQLPIAATPPKAVAIPLGHRLEGGGEGQPEMLPVGVLTRHTAIFAGSGSGKTVLLRRIVEEAGFSVSRPSYSIPTMILHVLGKRGPRVQPPSRMTTQNVHCATSSR
jgi:hypothetical protein